MTIDDCRVDDIDGLADLARKFYPENGTPLGKPDADGFGKFICKAIEADGAMVKLAKHDDKVIGAICGQISHTYFSSDTPIFTLMFWWVDSLFAGVGVGLALLNEAERWARNHGARCAAMGVMYDLEPASRILKERGYKAEETTYVKEL